LCISWTIKCWILLMLGVTMKFVHQLDSKMLDIVDARCNHEVCASVGQ